MLRGDSIFTWDKFNDNEEVRAQAMQSAAVGGPNSGFEIAGDDFFQNPELANEFPDMQEDIDLIISTESFIQRLVDFDGRMKQAGGMSRGMAYELLELVPSMESFVSPMHFTEDVSGVHAEISLEAISGQMWVLIAAACAFLVAIIYKFISWVFGGSSGGGSGDLNDVKKGIEETEKDLDEQEKIVQRVTKIVRDTRGETIDLEVPEAINKKELKDSHMPEVLKHEIMAVTHDIGFQGVSGEPSRKSHVKVDLHQVLTDLTGSDEVYRYMREPNKYARVVYSLGNKTIQLVMASFEGFLAASSMVGSQLESLQEMLKDLDDGSDPKDMEAEMRFRSSLNTLDELVLDRTVLKFGGFQYDSIANWAFELRASIHTEATRQPNFNDLEELLNGFHLGVERMKTVKFRNMIVFIELLQKAMPALNKLEAMAKRQKTSEKLGDLDRNGKERAAVIMRVHRSLSSNLMGLMKVYAEITRVYMEVSKHGFQIVDTLRKNAKEIMKAYNKFGSHPGTRIEDLVEELEATAKQMEEFEVKPHMLPKAVKLSGHVRVSFGDDDPYEDPNAKSVVLSEDSLRQVMDSLNTKKE